MLLKVELYTNFYKNRNKVNKNTLCLKLALGKRKINIFFLKIIA